MPAYRLALAAAAIYSIGAGSQTLAQDAATVARLTDVSQRYNECAYSSAISQLKSLNGDINRAAEQGFASCSLERDLLVSSMKEVGVPPPLIDRTILEKQTGIKRELRKMVEEVLLKN
ncbi:MULTISPECIES: hypothetical protein [Bradyrhizobium]|uniref:hypothetical protein n=1 Tax=Bradyrhizobium TaxID=374 RepID=UPI0035192DE8